MKIDEYIIYATNGVCKIEGIEARKIGSSSMEYYTLVPINDSKSIYYIPTNYDNSKIRIKPVMTSQQAKELVDYSKKPKAIKLTANPVERKNLLNSILKNYDRKELINLIFTLKEQENKLSKLNKHLNSKEQTIFNKAISLICEEVAFCLKISLDDAKQELHII